MALFPGHTSAMFSLLLPFQGLVCKNLACSLPVVVSLSSDDQHHCTHCHLLHTPTLQVGSCGPPSKEKKLFKVVQLGGGRAGPEPVVPALSRVNSPWSPSWCICHGNSAMGCHFGYKGMGFQWAHDTNRNSLTRCMDPQTLKAPRQSGY